MRRNLITDKDAYKFIHHLALNPGLTHQYVYGESRIGSKFPVVTFFGLDVIIKQNFMNAPSIGDIEEADQESFSTFGIDYFNMKGKDGLSARDVWTKVNKLGYIPMEIKAAPEGSIVPIDNVLFTSESTKDWFAKTINNLETLKMHAWYPTTISSRFKYIKESVYPLVEMTGTVELIDFMINDFGARGATWYDSAAMGGMACLVHGQGSDNNIASRQIKDFYGLQGRAKSVWATEHSVALSFGPGEGEYNYLWHQLENTPKNAIVSIVIDTYDTRNFMYNVVGHEKSIRLIKERAEAGGRVVFRPDSGIPEDQIDIVFDALTAHFGYSLNAKGYKVLDHSVGAIQGDGMNEVSIVELYKHIVKNRWSTDNLVVGSGGGLLQVDANRDTQRFAIKPSMGIINGEEVLFQKNPKTDTTKKSKAGKLKLHPTLDGGFQTFSSATTEAPAFSSYVDSLQTVFKNGEYLGDNHFSKIIERASRRLTF